MKHAWCSWLGTGAIAVTICCGWNRPASATPPNYETFGRLQRVDGGMSPADLLRIWIVYVGQGDGILIQLPERLSRSQDEDPAQPRERVDVLIDGGSANARDVDRMRAFIEQLYPGDDAEIEHAVVTHHDRDHVLGLVKMLESTGIGIDHVYHNGLASWVAGIRGLPRSGFPDRRGVYEKNDEKTGIARALGLLDDQGSFLDTFVMDDLSELRRSLRGDELDGIYHDLAAAIVGKKSPHAVRGFHRAAAAHDFVGEVAATEAPPGLEGVEFELLWPPEPPRKFGSNWGESINGNSVVFQLRYGDFEMLFTGDLNEASEKSLLKDLEARGAIAKLRSDVLKVPHHGSRHGIAEFFSAVDPVISVASQGPEGARSKALSGANAWEHPSSEVIEWLGGAHRVYLTALHERRFNWVDIDTAEKRNALTEYTHILIETDGKWFRIVEVPSDSDEVGNPPSVASTELGNGTRWIRAR